MQERTSRNLLFLYAVMPICSVFVTVGLLPYLLFALVKTRLRGVFNVTNIIVAPLILLVSVLFVLSNNADVPNGPLWEFQNLLVTFPTYIATLILEFGVFIYFARRIGATNLDSSVRALMWISVVSVLALSFWRLGVFNDLTTKGSYPAQMVLLLCYLLCINAATSKDEVRRARDLIVLLGVGCWSTLHVFLSGANLVQRDMSHASDVTIQQFIDPDASVSRQLFSDGQSFFWTHLAPSGRTGRPAE